MDRLENSLYDLRVRVTMPDKVETRVVVVDINEKSLTAEGPWPWNRVKLATLVDQLFNRYGVRVVAFDMLFPEKDEASALSLIRDLKPFADRNRELQAQLQTAASQYESDHRFAESLKARDVVLGFAFKPAVAPDDVATIGALPQPLQIDSAPTEAIPWIEAQGFVGVLPELQSNATTAGFIDTPLIDRDGVIRRTPLVQQYHGQLYESLALAAARNALGQPQIKLGVARAAGNRPRLKEIQVGESRISVDASGSLLTPYRGPLQSFPYVPATAVIRGQASAAIFKDAIVLIGATAVDRHPAALEAHANLITGILDQAILKRPWWSPAFEVVALTAFALFAALALPKLAPIARLLGVAAVGSMLVAVNLWLWTRAGLVLPLASPLVCLLATAALVLSYIYFIESRRKRWLSRVFSQYVPAEVVRELDATDAEVSLEGENREMSVLFSDVRGFTTLSEGFAPRELTRLMNELLTPLTDVIQKKRGTIDKYMGDAIMAFWGAPLPDPDHASRAVEAALQMIDTTKRMAADFASRGWPQLQIGVGISSGLMNVGNMGSQFRMAYTVLGDTVNLGSRLEGLTKQYGVGIVVSGATAQLCPNIVFRELDLVKVKGKNEPVAIYEPLGLKSDIAAAHLTRLECFAEMLRLYRARHFSGAQELLGNLAAEREEPLIALYKQRIAHFISEPPPGSWDGVYVHLTK
jgi:adenylate cyclase